MRNNKKNMYKQKQQVNVAERFMLIAKEYLPPEVFGTIYQDCYKTPRPKLNKQY